MLNRIVLIGRLTNDPTIRYTPSGTAVASFTLAVERPKRGNEQEVDFVPIVAWGKLAELCGQYLAKGRMTAVDGRLQIRSYENRDGQKVRVAEVVAENVQFLDRGDSSGPSKPSGAKPERDDPFADDEPLDINESDLPF